VARLAGWLARGLQSDYSRRDSSDANVGELMDALEMDLVDVSKMLDC
jgi:hypothetical protein